MNNAKLRNYGEFDSIPRCYIKGNIDKAMAVFGTPYAVCVCICGPNLKKHMYTR